MGSAKMAIANHGLGRIARAMLGGAALTAMAALSAGCSTTATSDVEPADYDYRLRHPILVSEEPENMDMPVGMKGPAISREIETAIREYVDEYRADGTGAITIQVPTGSANEAAAATTGHAVHYALVRSGVPRGHIQVAPYEVGDHAKVAPLRLSYLRVKAVVPRCGIWPDFNKGSYLNRDYHNLGCAQQQNLAAMVANPADFMRPQPMGPANGTRRANVIRIYADTGNIGWTPATATGLLESGGGF